MAKIPRRAPPRNVLADQLTAYQPTLRDRAANALLRFAGDNYQNQSLVGNLLGSHGLGSSGMGLIDFTPAGLPFAADEGGRKMASGHVASGLLDVGLAAIPIPAAAKGAKKAVSEAVDMSQAARLERARKAGYNVERPYYHGSPEPIDNIDVTRGGGNYGQGFYTTRMKDRAASYAGDGGAVYPVYTRGRTLDITTPEGRAIYESTPHELLRQQYDLIRAPGETIALNDGAVRSIFDPFADFK